MFAWISTMRQTDGRATAEDYKVRLQANGSVGLLLVFRLLSQSGKRVGAPNNVCSAVFCNQVQSCLQSFSGQVDSYSQLVPMRPESVPSFWPKGRLWRARRRPFASQPPQFFRRP